MLKHFTSTAYIVSKINGEFKVLLHKHKKHNLWIGIGGHVEEWENPEEALIREVKEETNLEIEFFKKKLLKTQNVEELILPDVILQERLSAYKNEPSHFHIDLIYFTFCKNPERIKIREKFAWLSISELKSAKLNSEVLKFSIKALKSYV